MIDVTTEQLGPMAREATRLLKALAHPSRLLICCQLREGEMSVGRIETTLGIRQPNLSRELARLREDGIVATRRESRVVFYRLQDARAGELIEAVCGVMLRAGTPAVTADKQTGAAASAVESAAPPAESRALEAATAAAFDRAGGYGVFARAGTAAGGGKR
jgi:DNA-binding transcriptional ArsR family regulator